MILSSRIFFSSFLFYALQFNFKNPVNEWMNERANLQFHRNIIERKKKLSVFDNKRRKEHEEEGIQAYIPFMFMYYSPRKLKRHTNV